MVTKSAVRLTTPVKLSLEQAFAYIDDDELVEVTPKAVRMRKRHLDPQLLQSELNTLIFS